MNKSENINIGEILSKRRIQLNKSIETIANDIHLSSDIIDKLENNEFKEIGNAVYTRGYLAAYAKILSLNEEEILADYQKTYASNDITIKPALGYIHGENNLQKKQRSKTISFLVALLAFFITLAIYFFNEEQLSNWINKNKSLIPSSEIKTFDTNTVNNLNNNIFQTKKETNQAVVTPEIVTPTISEAEQLLSEQTQEPIVSKENTTEEVIASAQIELLSSQNIEDNSYIDLVKKPLSIQFKSSCWIKVTDQSNTVIISKLYQAGESTNITAKGELTVITGRPNAIKQFNYAGKSFDLSEFKISKNKFLITP